jgi:hypothetical protein
MSVYKLLLFAAGQLKGRARLQEGIDRANAIVVLAMIKVFADQFSSTGGARGCEDQ